MDHTAGTETLPSGLQDLLTDKRSDVDKLALEVVNVLADAPLEDHMQETAQDHWTFKGLLSIIFTYLWQH